MNSDREDYIKDHQVLEHLAKAGFCVVMHGHIHRDATGLFRYDHSKDGRRVEIIGVGAFAAPEKQMVPGCPLQYNLLTIKNSYLTVESRCRQDTDGVWKPYANRLQGPGKDPLPRYVIPLPDPKTGVYPPEPIAPDEAPNVSRPCSASRGSKRGIRASLLMPKDGPVL